jgi:hypothetical protein
VILKHIKLRWLTLYTSINRLLEVFTPVKDYFLSLEKNNCPKELQQFFSNDEGRCVLSFLEHILRIIQRTNVKLQRHYLAAVNLHDIISGLKFNLRQRINSSFFGTSCKLVLSRLPTSAADELKTSFIRFIERVVEYIDEYYLLKKKDKKGNLIKIERIPPSILYESISPFGLSTINDIKWDQITKCIELFQIKNLNEDDLFNEFTDVQMIFKSIQEKNIPLHEQVRTYIYQKNIGLAAAVTKNSTNTQIEEEQEQNNSDDCDNCDDSEEEEEEEENTSTEEIRPDQLWAMLLSVTPTPSPNLHKLICFLFSIPCSNAYVESVFSTMKHLFDDKRNRMSTELIRAELQIRLNSSLRCTQAYDYFLSKPELLKLVHSSQKYSIKKQRIN